MSEISELKIDGRVATPGDPDWDEARQAFNLAADQQPIAVAFAESADDVAKVIRFAGGNNLGVAGQGTGHAAMPLGPLDGVILIKTERMRGVEIDGDTARVEAGVLASELGEAAHEQGRCSMPGTSPNVGLVGYTTGGGLSWLGREHGFACNRVSAIELVTADGERRTVDAESEPDLFWALRGGGGGYAIVTALHVELLQLSDAYAGGLLFPADAGADGVRAYRDWTASVPDRVSSMLRFLNLPPIPDVPEPLRGKSLLAVWAACIGSEDEGREAVAPLREIGEPLMDTFAQIPTSGLTRIAMDPEDPVPSLGDHGVLSSLPDEAIDAFVEVVGPESGSPLLAAELRHLGGALARPAENGGALDKLDAEFVMLGVGMLMAPELRDPIEAQFDKLGAAMKPWAAEGGYVNYAERTSGLDAILPADTCARLADVKRKWDPDGMIRASHAVSAATA
jgi:FAD binding domain